MEVDKKFEVITNQIGNFCLKGYDSFHLAAGTSIDGDIFAGVVIAKRDPETKEVFFVLVPYCSNYHLKNGSNHNKKPGETPEQVAVREVLEETGLHILPENLKFLFSNSKPDNRPNKTGKLHTRYFYVATEFTGNLFSFDGRPNPIDAETSEPLWVPAELLNKVIFGGHKQAALAAMDYLSFNYPDYAFSLMNVL